MKTAQEIEEGYAIEFERLGCDKSHVQILCARLIRKLQLVRLKEASEKRRCANLYFSTVVSHLKIKLTGALLVIPLLLFK